MHAELGTELVFAMRQHAASRIVLCSVAASAITAELVEIVEHHQPGITIERFTASKLQAGMRNAYAPPASLGPDRFAAAIGARAHFPAGALVIANFGTATTVDTVDPEGTFLGGVILPGLATMTRSMSEATACLPDETGRIMQGAGAQVEFPDRTGLAMAEGVARAQQGAVATTLQIAQARFGTTTLVLCGGAARVMLVRFADARWIEHAVLDGLSVSL
jgi:type III pantothenate kinase